jgi:hypothetical protein
MNLRSILLAAFFVAGAAGAGPPDPAPTPPPAHSAHDAGVDSRGDRVMGFDHERTEHRFRLTVEGGVIEAEARSAGDTESRDQIRVHFRHIAKMFSDGDFDAPMLIHGRVPPGVSVMKKLKGEIRYDFEPTERGGRIVLRTKNREALAAIHEFLRFQIREHRTGDPESVSPSAAQ